MTVARRQLIDAETTPYYHIICRCVRRAFLCGQDKFTGRDFSHRRQWIEDKLFELSKIFSIDIAAYAIMNNHYHLVLRIDQRTASQWTMSEVFEQYARLHECSYLVQQFREGVELSPAQLIVVCEFAEIYRERLSSISWFMKIINQHIALKANREDNCTGKFWESRFKSQALLDATAVLTCMAYVDLNPIRAGLASLPETSEFTSIQTRLNSKFGKATLSNENLLAFSKGSCDYGDKNIPFTQSAYFELVDWTGRCIRKDKRGSIPQNIPPLLERLNMSPHEWLRHVQFFEARYKRVAGTWESIKTAASRFGCRWFHGKPSTIKPLPD